MSNVGVVRAKALELCKSEMGAVASNIENISRCGSHGVGNIFQSAYVPLF